MVPMTLPQETGVLPMHMPVHHLIRHVAMNTKPTKELMPAFTDRVPTSTFLRFVCDMPNRLKCAHYAHLTTRTQQYCYVEVNCAQGARHMRNNRHNTHMQQNTLNHPHQSMNKSYTHT
jgi:hypothetical protein